ncbi:BZ3500_MvSof-1268-A1-R1_Chr9g10775 [Microbotryum saponariae]|uniref:BZ3500_MvSof-1268-A1-R1_Chr9g10775 protein n=1 Tax=Microbotryum saponariae TaxID=289078 RepID=A0A2X0L7T1_9BASI|nr:BZ3501_MvSof-1269-A2-R1_Chr9g10523 [Microbotryum saponariae]SDA00668.1 BZ3500_MvSof-1268-A1-R1_Chr9g10775 [Microbotryum saponariae]
MEDDEFELDFGEDELDVATTTTTTTTTATTTVEPLVTLARSSLPIKAAPPVQVVPSTSSSTSGSTPFSIPPVPLPGQASGRRSLSEVKVTGSSKGSTLIKPKTPVPSPPKPSTTPATSSQPKHDSSKDANGQPMLKGWVSRVSTSTGDIYYRKPATATSPTQSSWYIPGSAEWKADEERKAKETAGPASTTSETRAAAEKQPLPLSTASKTETEAQSRPSTQKQPTSKHSEGTSELAQGGGWHVTTNTTAAPSRQGPSGSDSSRNVATRSTVVTQDDRGPQPSEPARTVATKSQPHPTASSSSLCAHGRTPLPPQQAVIGRSTLTDPVAAAPVDGPSRRATPSSMEATRYASPSSGRDVALRPREAPIANGGPRFAADAPRFATDTRPNRIDDNSRWAQPAPPIQRSADSVPPTVGGANRVPLGNKRPNPMTLDPSTKFASPAVSVAASVPPRRRSPSPPARPVSSPPRRMAKEETRFASNRDVPPHIRSNLDRDRRPSPPPRRASPPPRRSSPSRRPVSTSNMHPLSAPQASTRPTNPDLELPPHLTRREPPRTTPDLHRDRERERERDLAPHLMNRTPLPPSSSSSRRRSRSPPPPPPPASSSVSAPTMNEWTHPDRQALVGANAGGMSRSSQGWVTNDVQSSGGAERSGYVGVGGVPNAVKNGGAESQGSRPMRTWGKPQSQVVQDRVQELGCGGEREREDLRRPRGERKEEEEVETKRRRVEGAEGRNRGTGWDQKVEREWGTGGWDLGAGANGSGNEGRDERREVRPNEDRGRDRRDERRYDDRVEERVQAPREPVPPPRAVGQGWETKSTSLSEANGWETKEQRPATRADDWADNSNRRDDRPERGDDRPLSDRFTESSFPVQGQGWAWKGKGDGRSLQPPPTEHRRSGDTPSHPTDRPLSDRFNGPSPPLTRQENQNQKWGSGNATGDTSISPRLGDREEGAFGGRGSDSLVGRLEGRSLSDRLGGRGGKEGGMNNGGKEAVVNRGSPATKQREKSLLDRVDSKSRGSGSPARGGRGGRSLLDRLS